MKTIRLNYAAGQHHALNRLKLANLRGMVAPTLAGAAIGGVGGAAMAPEGQELSGAMLGGGLGAAGGAGGALLGRMAGRGGVAKATRAGADIAADEARGIPMDLARANQALDLKDKALDAQRAFTTAGGAMGAGAGGYLGAQAAGKLPERPGSQPGLLPYEDDPYYMSQGGPQPSR